MLFFAGIDVYKRQVLLLVDENADELLASDVRQAVKDQLVDNFIYASVSPKYLAGVIDRL